MYNIQGPLKVAYGSGFNFVKQVYLSIKTCEVFLCFVAVVRVRVYNDVLRDWWVL